ncbi:homoserine kinase [Allokutzneria albata]|uniref:Homoserine kinase n=1 Tax=Allokutzneria albata TaxID=211114 RepID=A0A1G9XUC0_ALLAB|nr:homoserine kinase [Allokutzneria albata]SDN00422.1 homoserine kinase [Allokutzneria albata]
MNSAVRVTVPASTANLGSGFDALGMALAMHDVLEVEVADDGLLIEVAGEGVGQVPADSSHLVVRAVRAAFDACGFDAPGLRLRCHNKIPHARGLGSSAAAVVAGVAAGYALAGHKLDDSDLRDEALNLAAEFEGHADNAAASFYGGAVIAWHDGAKHRAVRVEPHPDLAPIAFVPEVTSSTGTTRGLLPERVPHRDAAFAAGRAALAVHAIGTRPDLLLDASADRLHQEYRRPAWPESMRLVDALREAGIAAAISGAGPTVLALPTGAGALPEDLPLTGFTAHRLPVDLDGVRAEPLGAGGPGTG